MTQCYKNHMESPRVNLDLRLEDELLTTTGAYKTKGNRNNFLKLKTLVCAIENIFTTELSQQSFIF